MWCALILSCFTRDNGVWEWMVLVMVKALFKIQIKWCGDLTKGGTSLSCSSLMASPPLLDRRCIFRTGRGLAAHAKNTDEGNSMASAVTSEEFLLAGHSKVNPRLSLGWCNLQDMPVGACCNGEYTGGSVWWLWSVGSFIWSFIQPSSACQSVWVNIVNYFLIYIRTQNHQKCLLVNIFPCHLKPYLYWLLFYACMSCLSVLRVILIFLWISNICIFVQDLSFHFLACTVS